MKIAVADGKGEFTELLREAIKNTPPENGEEVTIDVFSSNFELQERFEPGKYDAAIVCGDIYSYSGDTAAHTIRLTDRNILVAFYTKYNYLYIDKYDIGYYELTGKRPPDYSLQLEKLYHKYSLL